MMTSVTFAAAPITRWISTARNCLKEENNLSLQGLPAVVKIQGVVDQVHQSGINLQGHAAVTRVIRCTL